MELARWCIRWALLGLGGLFYRQVWLVGQIPRGPLLLAPNHPNGLLDGLALLLALRRPVAFLAKSTFFINPALRLILNAFGAVPVYRPQDAGAPGGALPGQRDANAGAFGAAHRLLREGGALAIFPEGTPNAGPGLLPLRSGLARIGLEAEAQAGWALGLVVVPVGLWFEAQTRAGTAVLVVAGEPIAVAELRARYEADPAGAVRELTGRLTAELAATVGRARRAGRDVVRLRRLGVRDARAGLRGAGPARRGALGLALALGAPPALAGLLLAIPGLALARGVLLLLARRHRASVGTIRLAALAAGLPLGWALIGAAGLALGPGYSAALLAAGPALGYLALRWREAADQLGSAVALGRIRRRRPALARRLAARVWYTLG